MLAHADSYLPDPAPSFWVSLRYFSLTRLVVAAVLFGAVMLGGDEVYLGETAPALFARTAIVYAVFGALFAYFSGKRQKHFYLQLSAQLALDLIVLTVLMHASGGTRNGIAVLFLLPIAGAAILSPSILAMGFAALSALAILGETVFREIATDSPSAGTLQAGLYGASCFAIALVMNRLAARLIEQERIALQRGQDLQSQVEINRVVVADMQDGVLVLSEEGRPRDLNPAAARLLGIADVPALLATGWQDHAVGSAIREQFLAWRAAPRVVSDSFEIDAPVPDEEMTGGTRRLRARYTAPAPDHPAGGDHVVFLEDLRRVEQRAHQLKLASMGRLTASIAHEIRNPLAAISHASALLAESDPDDVSRRLLNIVADNTRRLDRIVENILQLSRGVPVQQEDVDLAEFLEQVIAEFCRDQSVEARVVELSVYGRPLIRFNTDHLRQVVINLLQNASRYASGARNSIGVVVVPVSPHDVAVQPGIERIELIVQDDGPGIAPEARQHLFEPFYTTHHRGTGLGLYLARELCLANGATLGFVPNADVSRKGGFVVNVAGRVT